MTPQQQALLDFIRERIEESGCAPSYDEMQERFGWAGRGTAHNAVSRLIDGGHLVRRRFQPRGLALPDRPDLGGVATGVLAAELQRRGALEKPTVVIHVGRDNREQYLAFGDAPLRLLVIDECAPDDRVYEITARCPIEELEQLVPHGCEIGHIDDGRTPALINRLEAGLAGRRHLEIVE